MRKKNKDFKKSKTTSQDFFQTLSFVLKFILFPFGSFIYFVFAFFSWLIWLHQFVRIKMRFDPIGDRIVSILIK